MKLTEEQQKLVADNHNLIYWYAHRHHVNLDEYYDLLAIELCYTIMKYEEDKGSLSNYFKLRASGALYKEHRKTQAKKRIPKGVEFIDNMHSVANEDDMIEQLELQEWVNVSNSEILNLKVQGYSQTEIATKLGVSQSYISRVLKQLKRCYDETNR